MKHLFFILFSFGYFIAQAQTQPDWVDATAREMKYPHDEYIIGYVIGEIGQGESVDQAIARLKNDARVEAAASISVSISSATTQRLSNIAISNNSESQDFSREEFHSSSNISTKIDQIPCLTVEAWQRPKSNTIEAFAWAKKSDVTAKLQRQISMSVAKVDLRLQDVQEYITNGEKSTAKRLVQELFPLFGPIERDQKLLIYINSTLSDCDIFLDESSRLKKLATTLHNRLKSGISVYIDNQSDTISDNDSILQELRNRLIAKEISFAQTPDAADWYISIKCSTRQYSSMQQSAYKVCVMYADAAIEIVKCNGNKKIYSNTLTAKGVHTSDLNSATAAAFKNIGKQLGQIAEEHIN